MTICLQNLPPEDLVARLHVGEIQVGEHVRAERQDVIADRVPEVQHAMRLAARESRAIDHVGQAVDDRLDQLRVLLRIVFEVGVLDDDYVASRFGEPSAQRGALPLIDGMEERPDVRTERGCLRRSAVPSVEQSSTTMISFVTGERWTRSIRLRSVLTSL